MYVFQTTVDLLVVTANACVIYLLVQCMFQHHFSLPSEVLIVEHILVRCMHQSTLLLDLHLTHVLLAGMVPVRFPKKILLVITKSTLSRATRT